MLTTSLAKKAVDEGDQVTLLGKDIVSAFNNVCTKSIVESLSKPETRHFIPFIGRFLGPRTFDNVWDNQVRGGGGASDSCRNIHITNNRPSPSRNLQNLLTPRVYLFSYADDVNPLIITRGHSPTEHQQIVHKVDDILVAAATVDGLRWDASKEGQIDIGPRHKPKNITTLGIIVDHLLSFTQHIATRTRKAAAAMEVLTRLNNSNGGISPTAMRPLFTGCIHPIFL
ncbi:hypothetical protein EV426DRAFT_678967 [Tirmania nivea]|nr:hypothetical protein EV426DRAFT_678967 [Tirmania nivea]